MGPPLGEDGHGINVGRQGVFKAFQHTRQAEPFRCLRGTLRKLVHHINLAHAGMEIEQLRELPAELAGSYYAY